MQFGVQDVETGCDVVCPKSCADTIQSYTREYKAAAGYELDAKAYNKLLKACTRRCHSECIKGGATHDYVVNFRR
jgi:hypothetical protein